MTKDHIKRAERYINHKRKQQRMNNPNSRPTRIALAIYGMFAHGLPQGWGK